MLFVFTKVLIKNRNLQSLLVTLVAQFTAKARNSEKAIYFLSLMSCSINKPKSDILFTCKNFVVRFHVEKNFSQRNVGRGAGKPLPPFIYGPEIASLSKLCGNFIYLSHPAALLLAADGEVNKL